MEKIIKIEEQEIFWFLFIHQNAFLTDLLDSKKIKGP